MRDYAFAFCMGILFGITASAIAIATLAAWYFSIGKFAP